MEWYAHQERFIETGSEKHLMCWDTGTGKSFAALGFCAKRNVEPLIVVPKSLKEKWERDALVWTGMVVTKEAFKRDWDKLPKHDAVIFDEGHFFAGMKSQMHKAALAYIKKHAPRVILIATATPYMSTPWNIYALAKILGHHWSYMDFKNEFFDEKFLYTRTIPVVKPGIEREVARRVALIGSTVRLDECVDVPDQVFETETFALTAEQKKAKEQVKVNEVNPVVKFTKYHQIDNGTLKGNEYVPHQFIMADKTARILDLCDGNRKIAVVCRYNLQIDLLAGLLNKKGKNVHIIRGDVNNRDEVVRAVEEADDAIVLIQAACSEGYELPSVGVVVFASLSFSYKDYKQILGRFLRINALKKNVYIHLITLDSVDEAVFASVMRKQDFSLTIYAREHGELVSLDDEARSYLSDEVQSMAQV